MSIKLGRAVLFKAVWEAHINSCFFSERNWCAPTSRVCQQDRRHGVKTANTHARDNLWLCM